MPSDVLRRVTASSAWRTNIARRSASVCRATVVMPHPYSAFSSRTARIRRTAASPLLTTAIRLGNLTADGSDIRPVYVPRPEPKMQPATATPTGVDDRAGRQRPSRSTLCLRDGAHPGTSNHEALGVAVKHSHGRGSCFHRGVVVGTFESVRDPRCGGVARRADGQCRLVDARWGSFRIAVSVSVTSVAVAVSGAPRGGRSRSGRAGSPRKCRGRRHRPKHANDDWWSPRSIWLR